MDENELKDEVEEWEVIEAIWIKEIENLREKIKEKIAKHYNIRIGKDDDVAIIDIQDKREKKHEVIISLGFKKFSDEQFNKRILEEYLRELENIMYKYNLLEHWPVEYYTHTWYHDENNTRRETWTVYIRDNDNNMLLYFDEWVEHDNVHGFNCYVERIYYL